MPPRWGTVQVMSCCDSLVASRWSSRAWCSHEVVPVLTGDKTDTDNLSIVTISILILLSLFPKCNSRNAVKCHMWRAFASVREQRSSEIRGKANTALL